MVGEDAAVDNDTKSSRSSQPSLDLPLGEAASEYEGLEDVDTALVRVGDHDAGCGVCTSEKGLCEDWR